MRQPTNVRRPVGGGQVQVTSSTVFIWLALLSCLIIEVTLPRIGERRLNLPVFAGLVTFSLYSLITGLGSAGKSRLPIIPVLAWFVYMSWAFVSFYWSVGASDSILHASYLFISLAVAISLARLDVEKTITIFMYLAVVVCALSWIALAVSPSLALQSKGYWRLRGIMEHEFRLGYICAAALIFSALRIFRGFNPLAGQKPLPIILILFVAGTLFATQTRTLFIYTAVCLGIVAVATSKGRMRLLVFFGVVVVIVAAFYLLPTLVEAFSRGDGDASLSGRTFTWERTIALAAQRPWKGYGFASFNSPDFDYVWNKYRPAHAHNTWLQAYFETGLVGVATLTLAMVVSMLRAAWIAIATRGRLSYSFYLLLFITLSGLTGLVLGGKLTTLGGLFLIVFLQENYAYGQSRATAVAAPPPMRKSPRYREQIATPVSAEVVADQAS